MNPAVVVIVVGLVVASVWGADWAARKAWRRPEPAPEPYDVDAAWKATAVSVRAGSVVRITDFGHLYLSQLPSQRTPERVEPEVTA